MPLVVVVGVGKKEPWLLEFGGEEQYGRKSIFTFYNNLSHFFNFNNEYAIVFVIFL